VVVKGVASVVPKLASRMKAYVKGGGHHPVSQAAMKETKGGKPVPGYPEGGKGVLAIPNEVMKDLGIVHGDITAAQKSLYKAWRAKNPGVKPDWEVIRDVETKAMVAGGAKSGEARAAIDKAIEELKARGVTAPGRIPYIDN